MSPYEHFMQFHKGLMELFYLGHSKNSELLFPSPIWHDHKQYKQVTNLWELMTSYDLSMTRWNPFMFRLMHTTYSRHYARA